MQIQSAIVKAACELVVLDKAYESDQVCIKVHKFCVYWHAMN